MHKVMGYLLLALSALAWGAILTLPFYGVSWGEGAVFATVLVIIGEVSFLLAAALLGKAMLAKIKEYLRRG